MNFKVKELGNGAVEVALGTGATIVGLHAVRRMPKYAGWVLLGAGILGYVIAGGMEKEGSDNAMLRVTKTVSVVAASVGVISALNQIAKDAGVPAITGFKGAINKVIPQLAGTSLGNVEEFNENLLGELAAYDGLAANDVNDLVNANEPTLQDQLLGVDISDLM